MKKKSLLGKALLNTFIFSLILINLVLWPYLFSLIKGESAKPSEANEYNEIQSQEKSETPQGTTIDSVETNEDVSTETDSIQGEEIEIFKIIRIE